MKKNFTLFITFFMVMYLNLVNSQTPLERVTNAKTTGVAFQTETPFKEIQEKALKTKVPDEFKDYTLVSLDFQNMSRIKKNAPETLLLSVPLGLSQRTGKLELVKVNVQSEDFKLVEMPANREVEVAHTMLHYQGIIQGDENSIVAISISNREIYGLISSNDLEGNIVIGKLKDSPNHIIYRDMDINHLNTSICDTEDFETTPYTQSELAGNVTAKQSNRIVKVFFDIGNDIVNNKGGTSAASNYVQALFNQVKVLYANESITVKISGIKAWTSNPPFANDIQAYRSYRASNSWNGQLAQYLNYSYSGGIAYVNTLCNKPYAVGISGIHSGFSNVPTYSWSVDVVTHEFGHNFGSSHTHSCVWNGNGTAIDGCGTVSGCPNPGFPSGGGTIMSYCHTKSVGKNFNKGFGEQPGNLIRNRVQSCVPETDTNTCSWESINGAGFDIGSGAGNTYVVGTNRKLYKRNGNGWSISRGNTNHSRIDVDGSGKVWIVQLDNKIYRPNGNNWYVLPNGAAALDIGVTDGHVCVIGMSNKIYKLNLSNNTWQVLGQPSTRGLFIDVGASGRPWIIGTNDRVYEQVSNGNFVVRGSIKASDISIQENGSQIWIIEKNTRKPHYYNSNTGQWIAYQGTIKYISVNRDGVVWGTNINANIFKTTCSPSGLNNFEEIIDPIILETLEANEFDDLTIYPNPAKNSINVRFGAYALNTAKQISIIDIHGRKLLAEDIASNSNVKELNISHLKPGIYFITISIANKTIKKRIVKQ